MKKTTIVSAFAVFSMCSYGYGLFELKNGNLPYEANKYNASVMTPKSVEVWSSVADAVVSVSRIRKVDVYTNAYDITPDVHFVVTNMIPYIPSYFKCGESEHWLHNVHHTNWDVEYIGSGTEAQARLFYTNGVWHLKALVDMSHDPDYGKYVDLTEKWPEDNANYHDFKERGTMTFTITKNPWSYYVITRNFGQPDGTMVPEVVEWTQDVTNKSWRAFSRTCWSTNSIIRAVCTDGFISQTVTNEMFIVGGDTILTTGLTGNNENESTRATIVFE